MSSPNVTQPSDSVTTEQDVLTQISSDTSMSESADTLLRVPEEKIREYVLKEVKLKLDRGHSVTDIEDHLKNTASLVGGTQIPTTWTDVLKMMKKLGYTNPRHYRVCAAHDHSFLLKSKDENPTCRICRKQWNDCIDYYCLGLNFRDWFATEEWCHKLMAHWNAKQEWFDKPDGFEPNSLSELWHGERFRKLSTFWNTEKEYLLPVRCPQCTKIVSVDELQNERVSFDHRDVEVSCPHCHSTFDCTLQYTFGDPRNQAIIIHEDGWSPHSTSARHSIAAITISHACMSKADRCDANNSRVYSFIPVSQLPKDAPHKYDAFFEPLLREIEDLYIHGEEVFFKANIEGVSSVDDFPTLRVLPLLITADSRAHSEIGLTTAGGYCGCRRCTVTGIYIPEKRHHYYGNFRYRFRFRCPLRTANDNREKGRHVDQAPSTAERRRRQKEAGVTGECIFYRLHDLCGFDPVKDMVIDAMHAVILNLVRSELEGHLLTDLGENKSRPVHLRDPSQGGVLDVKDLMHSLNQVDWTTELKDGRVPSISPSHNCTGKSKLGHWKSEEFAKFILVAPVVLRDLIPRECYKCFCLLHNIYQLVFCEPMRVLGWSNDHCIYLESLLWKHAIMYEEIYGLAACTENVEYSLHMPEDVQRHSTPDNYWCFMYERLVRYYKRQTTNMKVLCKTFADRANQLHFVNTYLDAHITSTPTTNFSIETISKTPVLLNTKTASSAIELKEYLSSVEVSLEVQRCLASGIMIGCEQTISLQDRQMNDVQYWLQQEGISLSDIPNVAPSFKRVLKLTDYGIGKIFRVGEYVTLRDTVDDSREWLLEIVMFIAYGPVNGQYHFFVEGKYFISKSRASEVETDDWTGQPVMIRRDFRRLCVQPLSNILRKVMIYKFEGNNHLIIDPECPVIPADIQVPVFPKVTEIIQTLDDKLVQVTSINTESKTVHGFLLRKVGGRNPRWSIQRSELSIPFLNIVRIVPHVFHAGCIQLS